ncbi:MAG: membrane fusion protein (multidrug efflux system) [Oceanospirillaceae bacterium]|jgi:membrane fusion protein (multidrug efflux system)
MKATYYLLIITMSAFIASCGRNSEGGSLAEKRTKLIELQQQQATLNEEINTLQSEIGKLDTNKAVIATDVVVSPIMSTEFQHFVEGTGRLEAENNVFVTPKIGGAITRIYVKEGDYVKKGQTVATIDNTIMKTSMDAINTQMATAQLLFDKQESLWNQKIGTEVQYIQAKSQIDALKKQLATMKAQNDMNVVKSPISGYVDEVRSQMGEMASPGLGILRVVNFSELKVVAEIPDTYAGTISKGDVVKIKFPDLQKEITAKLKFVSQTINPVSRTFTIEANIPNFDKQLKPNLTAIVNINDQSRSRAIVIPRNMIQRTEEGELVYVAVQEGNKKVARSRAIITGLTYDGNIEITSGLNVGDMLITQGYQDVVDGQVIMY